VRTVANVTGLLPDVAAFDALPAAEAEALLRPACASRAWLAAMVAGRPYGSLTTLLARANAALAELDWPDVLEALAAHPRIGERAAGSDRESAWSRQEQSGASDAAAEVAEALRIRNVAYEARFDHVFLICAAGRTSGELLAALTTRLGNDPQREREVVRTELAAIVERRLCKTLC
jgi:2-oxo-4-hydroxy-4-carboxy-5-ureidoimidazoline decarboxylase